MNRINKINKMWMITLIIISIMVSINVYSIGISSISNLNGAILTGWNGTSGQFNLTRNSLGNIGFEYSNTGFDEVNTTEFNILDWNYTDLYMRINNDVQEENVNYYKNITNPAISFDGINDFMEIDGSGLTLISGWDSLTFSIWFKLPSFVGNDRIWSHAGSQDTWLYILGVNGQIRFSAGFSGGARDLDSIGLLSINTWHNVICVLDDEGMKLYIDGVLDNSNNYIGTIGWYNYDLVFMSVVDFYLPPYAEGLIYEALIYDRAINSTEVSYEYNNKYPMNTNGLVLWLRMDEGSGGMTYDLTANNNDGTIYEATWIWQNEVYGLGSRTNLNITLSNSLSDEVKTFLLSGTILYDIVDRSSIAGFLIGIFVLTILIGAVLLSVRR